MASALLAGDPDRLARPLVGPKRWLLPAPFVAIALLGVGLALAAPSYDLAEVVVAAALIVAIVVAVGVLPWARWPAGWQALPAMAFYAPAVLLEDAAGAHVEFAFLTALPVIWLALFHTRWLLLVGLALLAVVLFVPPLLLYGYPEQWSDSAMVFVLSCFGALAGQHLVFQTRRTAGEARAASHQARADRDLLNAYLDNAGSLVVVLDRAGRVTLFNRYAEEVTGYRADEVSGATVWHTGRDPAQGQAVFAEILASRTPVRWEADSITRSGERRRIVWNITGQTDETGQVTHVIAFGLDVTEQRATERLFANVLAAATEQMIAAIDMDGTFTVFNAGAERLLGYRADEMVGKRQVDLIHLPEELAMTAAENGYPSFGEMIANPSTPDLAFVGEWTLVRKDGTWFPARMSVNTMHDDGEPVGYVLVAHDITAEQEAKAAIEQALDRERAAADRLRDLDQVKSDFVASVSHDLRTPLTSIVGNTELLLDGDAGDLGRMQRRLLATVDRNARRLDSLVGDLLMLSRIESGTLRIHPRDVPVRDIIDGALEALAAQRSPDVSLDVEVPPEPVLVHGDPEQLERVTTNLVSNALKFTPPGGRVGISLDADPEQIRLAVSDTGIGIPKEELPHVFDRFFRSSRAASQERPGTGLGLTIAKSIVEQHGGTIQASSNEAGGTTMTVVLPRLEASADTSAREPA
jgi:hypothetical protein